MNNDQGKSYYHVKCTSNIRRREMSLFNRMFAEFIGSAWLVFGGCGSAVLAAAFPELGISLLGIGLASGLTLLTAAYAIRHISGCHLNPAVSIGLFVSRRFPFSDLAPYIFAQVLGGIAGAGVLYLIATGKADFELGIGFVSNGFGEHSPGGYSFIACLISEVILTFMFLMIILGATDVRAPKGFAPLIIGLGLTLFVLIGAPVTNLSMNPARSTATALYADGWAVQQLWLFWLAPILGAIIAGLIYPFIFAENKNKTLLKN